ncbi:MAG: DNA mismatch repair endonuclease MutL [Gammaproteobacteria bacterium]|jgi:DNA mismatch repair protein MutL
MLQTPRIHILPQYLANQIAAGEVIERPASVVKELLENSLDANATKINIEIMQGGIDGIVVQDNGCGVHPDDMLLTFSPHATSKIKSTEDLANIITLGFRGEALASISSVSELTLTSSQQGSAHAFQVKAQGRDINPQIQPAAHPIGTRVEVKQLFYNTPARRKFLRTAKTEWQYCFEMIQRVLLSRFDIDFTIKHNDKQLARFPISDIKTRIAKVLSKEFIDVAHFIDTNTTHLHLTGFVAPSDFTRSSHDWQHFFINGRMVKDKLIQHAMRQAFGESLYPGRYAVYVLYLTIDPTHVDVNVHPTKHEVRFHNARLVHDFIVKSLQDALQISQVSHSKNTPYVTSLLKTPAEHVQRTSGEFLTVLKEQLIITKTETGLGVVNLHAYFSYQAEQMFSQAYVTRQPLLTAQTFKVSKAQATWLLHNQPKLNAMGFLIDQLGEQQFVLREIPAILSRADISELWEKLLQSDQNDWIKILSCHAIPSTGLVLSRVEIEQILDAIDTLPESARCPHGLKVWQTWSLDEML